MEDEINLKEYMSLLMRQWKIIIFSALLVTVLTFVLASRQEPFYQAKATILVKAGGGASSMGMSQFVQGMMGSSGQVSVAGDLIVVLQSKAIASKVVEILNLRKVLKGWDNPEITDDDMASSIKSTLKKVNGSGDFIELEVEYKDPELTAKIANAYPDALSYYWNKLNYTEARKKKEYIESQLPRLESELRAAEEEYKQFTLLSGGLGSGIEVARLARELEIKKSTYTMLRNEYESAKLEESKEVQPFSVVDKAVVPSSPSNPDIKRTAFVGFVIGLILGVVFAFLFDYSSKPGKTNL